MQKITKYKASDGREFNTLEEVRSYEGSLLVYQYETETGIFNKKEFDERRKIESGHYGNGNIKRARAKCGVPASMAFDSIHPENVYCVSCVIGCIKTSCCPWKWEKRYEELTGRKYEFKK